MGALRGHGQVHAELTTASLHRIPRYHGGVTGRRKMECEEILKWFGTNLSLLPRKELRDGEDIVRRQKRDSQGRNIHSFQHPIIIVGPRRESTLNDIHGRAITAGLLEKERHEDEDKSPKAKRIKYSATLY